MFEKTLFVIRFHVCERIAILIVVDALERQFRFRLQASARTENAGRLHANKVLIDLGDRTGAERFAFGPAYQIAAVAIVGGEQVPRVFIRRVHQHVVPLLQYNGNDRVVEKRVGDLGVTLGFQADEDRICVKSPECNNETSSAALSRHTPYFLLKVMQTL